MLENLKQSKQFGKVRQQAKLLGSRMADHHVSLAVTGLSGSGKTAFITSLINQLLEANNSSGLQFFSVVAQGRLIGVKRDVQPDVTTARFAYEKGVERLRANPPQWPESTNGVSQVRLLIKYRNRSGLRKLLSEHSTLTLDITDYPGEWLLDLPLLDMDYQQWCQHFWADIQKSGKQHLCESFKAQLDTLQVTAKADEMQLQHLSEVFTQYLQQARKAGYQLIQPGRFVLPGDLSGAPVLQFFPLTPEQLDEQQSTGESGTNKALLTQRFADYQQKVIKPFYQKHFKRFDRQIVLVDCLSALNQGAHSFNDLRNAVNWLLNSFHYGRSNILKRLFSPNIDKLVFAATKADHITPDQQTNLVKLLESIVHEARQQIHYEGVATESTAFAAIRTSQAGTIEHQGQPLQVISGTNSQGKVVSLFPGEVPNHCPDKDFWQQQGFAFPTFMPMPLDNSTRTFPHIRLDHILEFVLADKLE